MAKSIEPRDKLFLDASFAIALCIDADEFHAAATELAHLAHQADARLLTTRAILLEIGNWLSRLRYRKEAIRVIESLQADRRVTVLPLDDELFEAGLNLFRTRTDKSWGLTDCTSFALMQRSNIRKALTADHHFRQAGFAALLLDMEK